MCIKKQRWESMGHSRTWRNSGAGVCVGFRGRHTARQAPDHTMPCRPLKESGRCPEGHEDLWRGLRRGEVLRFGFGFGFPPSKSSHHSCPQGTYSVIRKKIILEATNEKGNTIGFQKWYAIDVSILTLPCHSLLLTVCRCKWMQATKAGIFVSFYC